MGTKKSVLAIITIIIISLAVLVYKTHRDVRDVPYSFETILSSTAGKQIISRNGEPLNITYQSRWNTHYAKELHEIPDFLKTAFIISEDKRFYEHSGVDWLARGSAVFVNLKKMRAVRGASTITEQVLRMINERPRTLWSRWIEGFEAAELERHFDKSEILEFYLNQVPYASNRRGIAQAGRYYFDRDLNTLSKKEMLALVVLVRAPSRMDLYNGSKKSVRSSLLNLTERLMDEGVMKGSERADIMEQEFEIQKPGIDVSAPHFVRYIKKQPDLNNSTSNKVYTTLDSSLQKRIQYLSDKHLANLFSKNVLNCAALVADHTTGEVLAWVVGGSDNKDKPAGFIDAVTTPRQPGSALKPFLYALALEKGWSPVTIIDDSPLTESVGHGLHSYNNYSRSFYGQVTLRQALANSLNIPAVRTLQYVGAENYLSVLYNLGFTELSGHPDYYGDGISLGNGEVSLYNLVQAYSVLAGKGVFKHLRVFYDTANAPGHRRVYSQQTASLIANILSDNEARTLEFGQNSVLNIPVQTAVKTGTSSDYRDAWALGFNYKYTVGVWMGNLDQTPTEGLTGSTGPALLLRSIFSELTKNQETKPLYLSPKLTRFDFCINDRELSLDDKSCIVQTEWFASGAVPHSSKNKDQKEEIRIHVPSNNLHIAYDPRIPADSQVLGFYIRGVQDNDEVLWNINDKRVFDKGSKHLWTVKKGKYRLSAEVLRDGKNIAKTKQISFLVK